MFHQPQLYPAPILIFPQERGERLFSGKLSFLQQCLENHRRSQNLIFESGIQGLCLGAVVAQSGGDWAERQRVPGSSPSCRPGEVAGHLQSATEIPLSRILNPQLLRAPDPLLPLLVQAGQVHEKVQIGRDSSMVKMLYYVKM